MHIMPKFISIIHRKFLRIVQNLCILSVSPPKLSLRELMKDVKIKYFIISFSLLFSFTPGQPENNPMELSTTSCIQH